MMTCSAPIAIAPARVWRSYRGGSLIGQIHRKEEQDGHYPEEWLMSVIEAHNPKEVTTPGEGLSMLLDGSMSLQDAILMDPGTYDGRRENFARGIDEDIGRGRATVGAGASYKGNGAGVVSFLIWQDGMLAHN